MKVLQMFCQDSGPLEGVDETFGLYIHFLNTCNIFVKYKYTFVKQLINYHTLPNSHATDLGGMKVF